VPPELAALPDTELVPVVPAEPPLPVEAPFAGDELADAGGLVEADWLGLVEADRVGVVFALGVVLALGVWLAQLVAWLVGAAVPLALAVD
jgi:hypothetical protein